MGKAFIRKYELAIGRNEIMERILPVPNESDYVSKRKTITEENKISNDFSLIAPENKQKYYKDFVTTPTQTLTITDLHIETSIPNTNNVDTDSSKGATEIAIFNLSSNNRNYIKTGSSVLLKAGYEGENLPLVYVGQIIHVEHTKVANDWITRIHCKSDSLTNQNKISKAYAPGTTLKEILGDLLAIAGTLGISTAMELHDPFFENARPWKMLGRPYPFGYCVQGNIMDMISMVCNQNGLRSYMVLGRIYIEPKYSPPEYRAIINIYPDNVKGALSRAFDAAGKDQTSAGSPEMLTGKLFLNGNIAPGIALRVTYGQYRGDYIVRSVTHKLSYESGSDWDTEIHCEQAKGNASRS